MAEVHSAPAPAQAQASSSSTHTSPTVLSTLHTLLLSSTSVPGPLDHPFAPSSHYGSWKGKGKSRDIENGNGHAVDVVEQKRLLESLRSGLEAAKSVLGRAVKEEGRTKLARAMKDV